MTISSPSKPRIGYQNLLEDTGATISATAGATGFEHANAYDWLTFTSYLSNTVGVATIKASFGAGIKKTANYFAVFGHTLATNGGAIKLQWSDDDAVWNDAFPAISPVNAFVIYKLFNPIEARYWRVHVDSTPASYIAQVSFGVDLELERGGRPGFIPPNLGREVDVTNVTSENGGFLGRSVVRNGLKGSVNISPVSEMWARQYWLPFVVHAELKPFFLQWNNSQYPYESAYVWADGAIEPMKYTKFKWLGGGIKYRGQIQ
jgi:hypothetical protein